MRDRMGLSRFRTMFPVTFAICFLIIVTRVPSNALTPGVDYVPDQVVVTFSEGYMPSETDVTVTPPGFGIGELDSLIEYCGGVRLKKFLSSYNRATSVEARFLEKTFVIKFDGRFDAQAIVDECSQLPYFDYVDLNLIERIEYFGASRFVPHCFVSA